MAESHIQLSCEVAPAEHGRAIRRERRVDRFRREILVLVLLERAEIFLREPSRPEESPLLFEPIYVDMRILGHRVFDARPGGLVIIPRFVPPATLAPRS